MHITIRPKSRSMIAVSFATMIVLFITACESRRTEPESRFNKTTESSILTNTEGMTSGRYLYEYMVSRYEQASSGSEEKDVEEQRLALVTDVYIKTRSYATINKIFFFISSALGLIVLIWPSVAAIAPKTLGQKPMFKSAIVQTTVTALAAASFFVYSDYKGKQQASESLMRYVIHSSESAEVLTDRVIEELSRIDNGFSFSKAIPGNGAVVPEVNSKEQ